MVKEFNNEIRVSCFNIHDDDPIEDVLEKLVFFKEDLNEVLNEHCSLIGRRYDGGYNTYNLNNIIITYCNYQGAELNSEMTFEEAREAVKKAFMRSKELLIKINDKDLSDEHITSHASSFKTFTDMFERIGIKVVRDEEQSKEPKDSPEQSPEQ